MEGGSGSRGVGVTFAVLSALISATYYIFVLAISPSTRPTAVLVYPFLIGGLAYVVWCASSGQGRAFLRVWTEPSAYLRTGVLVAGQLSVLAATYLTGPVDASLLSLIGDVAATPLVAVFLFGSRQTGVRSGWFAAGLLLSLAGGTLAIVGTRSLEAIPPLGWLVVPAVPLSIAFYVLLTARANERAPPSAIVGQSMLGAGLVSLLISPEVPGAIPGLTPPGPVAWAVLAVMGLAAFFAVPVLYFESIRQVGVVLPPVLMTAIPVFTLVQSWTILHLPPTLVAALGIPVAVLGGMFAVRGLAADRTTEGADWAGVPP